MSLHRTTFLATAAAALLLFAAPAIAAFPATLAGGFYVSENRGPATGVMVLQQGTETTPCKFLTGQIQNFGKQPQPVSGFYCPETGRVVLSRETNKLTQAVFSGQVSRVVDGTLYMAGTLSRLKPPGSGLGEVSFLAFRPNED